MKYVILNLLFIIPLFVFSQKEIKMNKVNGVYQIPCKVNGIPMNFILDTGASDISISLTETEFLIKQGLLTEEDFVGKIEYQIADGSIKEGTIVILKTIEIDNIILTDLTATIVHEQNAPLLFGQSAIKKLGPYRVNGDILTLDNFNAEVLNNQKEFDETLKWISKNIGIYSYFGNDFNADYFVMEFKHKNGGYALGGLTYITKNGVRSDETFIIPIHKIKEIKFTDIPENNNQIFMVLIAKDNKRDFVVNDHKVDSSFHFILNSGINEDNMRERFIKAFNNLIEINQTFIYEKF